MGAVTYDLRSPLDKFWQAAKIHDPQWPELKSKTIEAFGIRNKGNRGARMDGVPCPGTIFIGCDGKVAAKLFFDGHKKRHQAKDIVEAVRTLPMVKASFLTE